MKLNLRRSGVVAPLAAMVALAAAPSASAAPKTIQGFVGGPVGPSAGAFVQPRDVAVYEGVDADPATDKWFTIEAGGDNMRVQRFDHAGNFELMWGKDVDGSNPSTGYEVCTVAADCRVPSSEATGTAKGEFNNPMGVSVDQLNGWVYVYDRANRRIQKFDLDGNFILAFGKGVNVTTAGDVCTQASGDTCGAGVNGTGAGQLATTSQQVRGIAVHPSSGDLFVSDPQSRRILQYQSDGAFIRGWGFGVDTGAAQFQACTTASTCQAANSAGLANGQFSNNSPLGLAVDSQGVVYATDVASGTSANRILRFDSDLAPADPVVDPNASAALLDPILPTGAGGPLLATTTAPNDLEIDADSDGAGPDEESLLAVRDPNTPTDADTVIQELDIPTEAGEFPADPVTVVDTHTFLPFSVSNNGLGVNGSTGQIALTNSGALAIGSFPACDCPLIDSSTSETIHGLFLLSESSPMDAEVDPPSDPTSSSVQLNGSVEPGLFVRYRFQISTDGDSWTGVGPARYAGGSQPTDVEHLATGLDPNTLYRVRLSLRRVTGLVTAETLVSNEGLVLTDAIAPSVETLGSAHRTNTSVQLRASIDPNGSATSYRFEYGPEGGSFSNHVPIPDASAGSGNTVGIVLQQLSGLVPNTAYHYRVVATNSVGTSTGAAVSFSTTPTLPVPGSLGSRAYELVSPPDKVGGVGVGRWGGGIIGAAGGPGSAALGGERFAVPGAFGSVLMDGEAAYGGDWAFAERTLAGWASHSPVTHAPSAEQSYIILGLNTASDDLSTVLWGSNGNMLRPFPELASWPGLRGQFVGDWDGRWEILAPTNLDQVYANTSSLTKSVVSADGSSVVATIAPASGKAALGGMAGLDDPAHPNWATDGEFVSGRLVYLDDVSAGLSNEFEGNGVYSNVGVCADGTDLPRRLGSGMLEDRACEAPLPGRSARLISSRGAAVHLTTSTDENASLENVVSEDGSRVFFLSPDPGDNPDVPPAGVPATGCTGTDDATVCAPQLFVRQRNDDGSVTTRWISRAEDGLFGNQEAGLTGPVRFAGASSDGDRVFFQTTSPLTADDPNGTGAPAPVGGVTTGTASTSSWDLYMYDLPDGPGADPADGTLTRVSAGPTGDADCNVVTSANDVALRFAADDGSRAYFTCAAPLDGTALSQNGTTTAPEGDAASADATNLYAYDTTGDTTSWKFVARLPRVSTADSCATRGTRPIGLLSGALSGSSVNFSGSDAHCVRGTADGAFVTFWTTGRLTLDDPDSVSVDGYAYDADADELTRITAPQGGVGGSYPCGFTGAAATTPCHGDNGFGAFPAIPPLGVATTPTTAGDRIAYFQTRSRLVPADVDDAYDVYQWRNGELELLSTGDSPGDPGLGGTGGAFYAGNDADGRNVYMATNNKLSWQDSDAVMDVYTARLGGGIPQPAAPSICGVVLGGCQGGATAPTPVPPAATRAPTDGGNATPAARAQLSLAAVGRKARRRAARTGVLALRVRTSKAGRLSAVARGKVGKRTTVVGRAAKRVDGPGTTRLRVRLNRPARRALRAGRVLRVRVAVGQPGARGRSIAVQLRRGARS